MMSLIAEPTAYQPTLTITQYNRQMNIARTVAQRNFAFAVQTVRAEDDLLHPHNFSPKALRVPKYELFLRAAMEDLGLLHHN